MKLRAPPIKVAARDLGLPVHQPAKIRAPEALAHSGIVAARHNCCRSLRSAPAKSLLSLPRLGCINIHASLLPRHRGAAPVQAAILAGDSETGITIMQVDEGLDTGDILAPSGPPRSHRRKPPGAFMTDSHFLRRQLCWKLSISSIAAWRILAAKIPHSPPMRQKFAMGRWWRSIGTNLPGTRKTDPCDDSLARRIHLVLLRNASSLKGASRASSRGNRGSAGTVVAVGRLGFLSATEKDGVLLTRCRYPVASACRRAIFCAVTRSRLACGLAGHRIDFPFS